MVRLDMSMPRARPGSRGSSCCRSTTRPRWEPSSYGATSRKSKPSTLSATRILAPAREVLISRGVNVATAAPQATLF